MYQFKNWYTTVLLRFPYGSPPKAQHTVTADLRAFRCVHFCCLSVKVQDGNPVLHSKISLVYLRVIGAAENVIDAHIIEVS